jgi:hypothetical protein
LLGDFSGSAAGQRALTDGTRPSIDQRELCVHEDRYGTGEWHVSYYDDDGGCYVTVFGGPEAEWRAREYFGALKTGQLRTTP